MRHADTIIEQMNNAVIADYKDNMIKADATLNIAIDKYLSGDSTSKSGQLRQIHISYPTITTEKEMVDYA